MATVHHFGLVVPNIEAYLPTSVWELRGQIVSDPKQQARLCMVGLAGDPSPPLVELIEPVGSDSPVERAQRGGPAWHHVCFHFAGCAEADAFANTRRMLPVSGWKPAVLFEMRQVRFAYTRDRQLIEFLSDETAQ
jgi:hypothetical protein